MHKNDINTIAECNLIHDVFSPYKFIKNRILIIPLSCINV